MVIVLRNFSNASIPSSNASQATRSNTSAIFFQACVQHILIFRNSRILQANHWSLQHEHHMKEG